MARRSLVSFFLVALSYVAILVSAAPAAPLAKRTQILLRGGKASVQWSSNGNTINNLRNYHIRADGMIMESGKASDTGAWINNPLGMYATPASPLSATLVKLGDGQGDVEIRLFYQAPRSVGQDSVHRDMYQMAAAIYTPSTGWQLDSAFNNNVAYVGYPASAVTWKDSNGVQQYRLYWISWGRTTYTNWALLGLDIAAALVFQEVSYDFRQETGKGTVYEVKFSSGASSWSVGNGGNPIAVATTNDYNGGTANMALAAVQWQDGNRISVFFTDAINLSWERPYEVKETRWSPSTGWAVQPRPSGDWKNFNAVALAANAFYNPNVGEWVLDLFVKWNNECATCGSKQNQRMVEFRGGPRGWSRQIEMAAAAVDTNSYDADPISVVAWFYGGRLNQRLYFARQQESANSAGAHVNMREVTRADYSAWANPVDFDNM